MKFTVVWLGLLVITQAAGQAVPEPIAGQWFEMPPVVYGNPIDRCPLVAIVECRSTVDAQCSIEVDDGERRWLQPAVQPGGGRHHRVAVMGLGPGNDYRLRVLLQRDGQVQRSAWLTHRAPDLPSGFPPLDVEVAPLDVEVAPLYVEVAPLDATPLAATNNPRQGFGCIALFAVNLWIDDESMLDYGYIIALDGGGRVVWYCRTADRIADLRLLANGNLLYQQGSYRTLHEIDWHGRDVRSWYASRLTEAPDPRSIPVAVDTLHHDVLELPNGNFLTLATEVVPFDHFPTSETDPAAPWGPARVVTDAIVEFRPEDGAIIHRRSTLPMLDRQRFGYMSLGNFWRDKYDLATKVAPARDWSHANGLLLDPNDKALIVSFRHLDCLIKVDWPSGAVRWILGDPDGWGVAWQRYLLQPVGEFEWFYHQHSPQRTADGVMLYDNGNYRARPYERIVPAKSNSSRIVEYAIQESNMTVRQIFSLDQFPQRSVYCPFYGDAQRLPNGGHLLVTHGGHVESDDGEPIDQVPGQRQWAEVLELAPDGVAWKTLWRAKVDSGLGSRYGWSIYRTLWLEEPWSVPLEAPPRDYAEPLHGRNVRARETDPRP